MSAADKLSIYLFGGARFERNGTAVSGFISRKADALLIYLASVDQPVSRETAASLLWGDQPQKRALANLSLALSSLRQQIAPFLLTDGRATVSTPAGSAAGLVGGAFSLDFAWLSFVIEPSDFIEIGWQTNFILQDKSTPKQKMAWWQLLPTTPFSIPGILFKD